MKHSILNIFKSKQQTNTSKKDKIKLLEQKIKDLEIENSWLYEKLDDLNEALNKYEHWR